MTSLLQTYGKGAHDKTKPLTSARMKKAETRVPQSPEGHAPLIGYFRVLETETSNRNSVMRGLTVSEDLSLPWQERDNCVQRQEHVRKAPHTMGVQEAESMLDLKSSYMLLSPPPATHFPRPYLIFSRFHSLTKWYHQLGNKH